jgi:mono/diheme cytochrome c family protein
LRRTKFCAIISPEFGAAPDSPFRPAFRLGSAMQAASGSIKQSGEATRSLLLNRHLVGKEMFMSARRCLMVGAALLAAAVTPLAQAQSSPAPDMESVERGRYLVKIAACNDCHTPGYARSGGKVAEQLWLTGGQVGYRGPWGTTYAANLRLVMQNQTEEEWLKIAKTAKSRPPMPWFALHDMTTADLSAIYRFVRYLGHAGQAAPDFVPPGQEPKGPFVQFPEPAK